MKKVIVFLFCLIQVPTYGQNEFRSTIKNSNVACLYLNKDCMDILDSFEVVYCSPLYRLGILDSIPYFINNQFFIDHFNKYKNSNPGDEFTMMPNPKRVLQSGYDFLNSEIFYDRFSYELNHEILSFCNFDVIGKKEFIIKDNLKPFYLTDLSGKIKYKVNPNDFKSILIIEKYFESGKQITSSVFFRLKNGMLIDPGTDFHNLLSLGL